MSVASPLLAPLLQRLLAGGRDGSERLITDLHKAARELAVLSLNYNGHSIRAGVHNAAMTEIDTALDEASSTLSRLLFELQQQLLLDVQMLTLLSRIEVVVDLEDDRPLPDRILHHVTSYTTALGPRLDRARLTATDISARLRVLANNTEIAACRAGESSSAPVELFMTIAAQMRALATRLRACAVDLTIFEQTQQGNAEAVRGVLAQDNTELLLGGLPSDVSVRPVSTAVADGAKGVAV